MKRIAYSLLAAALALSFNACEGQNAENLPEKYQQGGHGHGAADSHDKADPHAKPADAKAGEVKHPEGEKKAHP